jgi:hypothetical protein
MKTLTQHTNSYQPILIQGWAGISVCGLNKNHVLGFKKCNQV